MGKRTKKQRIKEVEKQAPKLASRRANKKSTIRMGRTIAAQRERVETSSERMEARKKGKKKQNFRTGATVLIFAAVIFAVAFLLTPIIKSLITGNEAINEPVVVTYAPTIEIIDMDELSTGGVLTSRMRDYIGQLEVDLKDLGYKATLATIPSDSIREVDFNIEGYDGYIKTTIDRGTGVTAEDIDRMIKYLQGKGVASFEYIDVRVPGRAYWR